MGYARVGSNPAHSAGGLAQMVERSLCMREVMGSIPIISSNKSRGRSSNGRAFAKQVKGRRIDTFRLQLSICNKGLGIAQLEEHQTVMET